MGWKNEKKFWALMKLGSDCHEDFMTLSDDQAVKVLKKINTIYPGSSFTLNLSDNRWKLDVKKADGHRTAFYADDLGQVVMSAWLFVSGYEFEVSSKGNAITKEFVGA